MGFAATPNGTLYMFGGRILFGESDGKKGRDKSGGVERIRNLRRNNLNNAALIGWVHEYD